MRDDSHHGDPRARPPGGPLDAAGGETSQCPHCGLPPHAKSVPITEKREFDFSNLVSGAGAGDVYVVLCPALCVLAYTRLRLSIRVHALTMSSGQLLRFFVWNTLPSEEDPTQEFVESTALATVDIDSNTSAPSLVTSDMASDPDAYVKISVRVTQTSAGTPFTAILSVNLLVRMD